MLIKGDCIEAMRELDEASVDAICTDPPYGLEFMGKEWDRLGGGRVEVDATHLGQEDWYGRGAAPFGGGGQGVRYGATARQMQAWHQAWATEALRVLKPGGHLLAFGGTRTYHRLACAVEDAGFEIRDSLIYIYGSGFPKSLDVSKAIDKRGGVDVAWFGPWLKEERERRGISRKALAVHFPSQQQYAGKPASGGLTGCVGNWETGVSLPTNEQFNKLCEVLDLPFDRIEEAEREVLRERTMVQGGGNAYQLREGERRDVEANVTAPATPEATQWQGWGTALKPSHEPIVVARKPLSGTVAANVLEHGTGALNVDGCRIGTGDNLNGGAYAESGGRQDLPGANRSDAAAGMMAPGKTAGREYEQPSGRWPPNLALSHLPECERVGTRRVKGSHDQGKHEGRKGHETAYSGRWPDFQDGTAYADPDGLETITAYDCAPGCPVAELDRQSGERPGFSGGGPKAGTEKFPGVYGDGMMGGENSYYGDTGGASRFFATFQERGECGGLAAECPTCGGKQDEPGYLTGPPRACPDPFHRARCSTCGSDDPLSGSDGLPWDRERCPDSFHKGRQDEGDPDVRFQYTAKASRSERNAGLEGVGCSCDTFTEWVNEGQSQSTPAGSDTPPPRATTAPSSEADSDTSTIGSGSRSTGRSPTASTSTTSTATSRTTASKTSPSSTHSPTSEQTPRTTESATENGSDAAESARSGSPPPPSTTTSASRAGFSTDDADRATSESSSSPSNGVEQPRSCSRCGGVVGGALRNAHPT